MFWSPGLLVAGWEMLTLCPSLDTRGPQNALDQGSGSIDPPVTPEAQVHLLVSLRLTPTQQLGHRKLARPLRLTPELDPACPVPDHVLVIPCGIRVEGFAPPLLMPVFV